MGYYEEDSFIMDQNFIKDRIGQLVADIRQVDAFNTDGISNLRIF